jgi:hypothetical protein
MRPSTSLLKAAGGVRPKITRQCRRSTKRKRAQMSDLGLDGGRVCQAPPHS